MLQWTKLPMVSDAYCNSTWRWKFFEKEMICAGFVKDGSPNTCSGDSGGPLICHQNGQTVLTGIVSGGQAKCSTKIFPKLFTRVTNYIEWIQNYTDNPITPSKEKPGSEDSKANKNSQEDVKSKENMIIDENYGSCPKIPKFMRGFHPQARIVDGQRAYKPIPWQVSIQKPSGHHGCGGAILDKTTVLTAAHCVQKKKIDYSTWYILAGQVHRKSKKDRIKIAKVILHPKYGKLPKGIPNDIAIVKLSKPLTFGKAIQPMCLPSKDFKPKDGEMCFVSGWGTTKGKILQKSKT